MESVEQILGNFSDFVIFAVLCLCFRVGRNISAKLITNYSSFFTDTKCISMLLSAIPDIVLFLVHFESIVKLLS